MLKQKLVKLNHKPRKPVLQDTDTLAYPGVFRANVRKIQSVCYLYICVQLSSLDRCDKEIILNCQHFFCIFILSHYSWVLFGVFFFPKLTHCSLLFPEWNVREGLVTHHTDICSEGVGGDSIHTKMQNNLKYNKL